MAGAEEVGRKAAGGKGVAVAVQDAANRVAASPQPATPGAGQDVNLPQLQNIVSTVNLGCRLELKEIVLRARNAEYNPKRFAAVIMRIRDPKTTALIFSSGKMVVTGAKSEESSRLAARKYAKTINKIGFDVKFKEFKIQNIVGSCDVGFPINLDDLALSDHSRFCTYEPELFPGLIYRMSSPKVVLLIFVSGKLVVTGAKARTEIYSAFDKMRPVLFQFNKQQRAAPALADTAATKTSKKKTAAPTPAPKASSKSKKA